MSLLSDSRAQPDKIKTKNTIEQNINKRREEMERMKRNVTKTNEQMKAKQSKAKN